MLTALTLCLAATAASGGPAAASEPARAGEPGGPGLALIAAKVLTATEAAPGFVDNAVLLVRDGKIEAVGPRRDTAIPAGYEVIDLGRSWLMPGMIDLHTHIGGSGDINDMVYQTNEGLRVSTAVVPQNPALEMDVRAGVTTVLFIPGSGTNVGGQGILIKTGLDTFEAMRVRDPGSLKIAMGDNPTRWGYGMGRAMMNFHIRSAVKKGLAHARARKASGADGPRDTLDIQYEVFESLADGSTQISTHTQVYQLVMNTIRILKEELGLDVYIDHGEWGAHRLAPLAQKAGVAAICGPRIIDTFDSPRSDTDGAILSVPGEYQRQGLTRVGFNTDAPVVPAEELPLQAGMGVRYGFDNSRLDHVRGLTIVPALVAGIADRVGSLEPGKDADVVVLGGDPADPRSGVERVYIEGQLVYRAPGAGEGPRKW
jgi:imidazolonepropionase-like amidohydrolase